MRRTTAELCAILAGLAMALALPALSAADVKAEEKPAAPARAFIERSLVMAPEQSGKFVLRQATDFPGDPGSGIALRYQHADFPDAHIDLYVYPAGRVDRDTILARGMQEIRGALGAAAQQGYYQDLEVGAESRFDLRRVDADGALLDEAPPADGDARPEAGELLAAMAGTADATEPRVGRRLDASLRRNGAALNSRAYLFYRGLYLYKARISAAPTDLPGEAFDRFSNHAMAVLVPPIVVRSTGGCHVTEVFVDPDAKGDEGAKDTAAQLIRAVARAEYEQCVPELDDSVPPGFRALPLVFDPAMWNGQD